MNKKIVPTDWKITDFNIDVARSYDNFYGKTIGEVVPYFRTLPMSASEDLLHMPDVAFQYYISAFEEFLLTAELLGKDTDSSIKNGASCYLRLLVYKLTYSPQSVLPIWDEVNRAAKYVAARQDSIGASLEVYGSFPDLLNQICELYKEVLPPEN